MSGSHCGAKEWNAVGSPSRSSSVRVLPHGTDAVYSTMGRTGRGSRRSRQLFVEGVTGLALNGEEHTITRFLLGRNRPHDWKALETFAEVGPWDLAAVPQATARAVETAPGRVWHGYRVWAGDDTKVPRTRAHVWGPCTEHAYTARCPNRARTVRAHHGVVLGALRHQPAQPAWFVPVAGRRYFRQSPLPSPRAPGAHASRSRPSAPCGWT